MLRLSSAAATTTTTTTPRLAQRLGLASPTQSRGGLPHAPRLLDHLPHISSGGSRLLHSHRGALNRSCAAMAMGDTIETSLGPVTATRGATDVVNGLHLRELFFEVPLDYTRRAGAAAEDSKDGDFQGEKTIQVFAREVTSSRRPTDALPYLLYLQGGPGFESPRPAEAGGWLDKACESFRVLLLDQRGTGRSTPITSASLQAMASPQAQADYLAMHRADNIVRDAEVIRQCLGQPQWSIIGQSFGGFCSVSYLSMFNASLKESFITGGLPPTDAGSTATKVYEALHERVRKQNAKYYERFPQDKGRVAAVVAHLLKCEEEGKEVRTPAGNTLTVRSLQSLGIRFGSAQGFETIHFMFENAFEAATGDLSYKFLKDFDAMVSIDTNVLYALLHESIYVNGSGQSSGWAADRVAAPRGNFDAAWALAQEEPIYFTGEMIFPFMFDDIAQLRPLKEAANLLASKNDWPELYDDDALRENRAKVAAAVYFEDMYVDLNLSMETAGKIRGIRTFVTNEYLHSGIRENGPRIFEKLMNMTRNVETIR